MFSTGFTSLSILLLFPRLDSQWDDPFYRIAFDYSHADWEVFVIISEMFHGKISLNSVVLLLLVNFVSGLRLGFMYISLIKYMRSILTHLHGFQLLVLLPQFIEITFFT